MRISWTLDCIFLWVQSSGKKNEQSKIFFHRIVDWLKKSVSMIGQYLVGFAQDH